MAKKRKDPKSTSTACQEDNATNGLLSKEDENQCGIEENVNTHQNTLPSNHLQTVVQCPYTTHSNVEQSSLVSKPFIQWQQPQHQQQNSQPFQPIWMTQRPVYPFSPVGTTDVTWQGPAIRNQPQTPSFSYPPSYPYPGFPGPWDPSSWWVQPQQSLPSCSYTFPGACGYLSSLPASMPGRTAALTPLLQRGTIQQPTNLSQKHQQLWEAQSAENVQLWNVVGQLQSELGDYKNRLANLDSNILLPNSRPQEHANLCALDSSSRQKTKRGRPKKPIAPNNIFQSSHDSQSPSRVCKRGQHNVQTEPKEFENQQDGKMREDKIIQHTYDRKTDISFGNCNGNITTGGGSALFQDIQVAETSGVGLKTFTELKPEGSEFKGTEGKSASPTTYAGMTSDGNFVWPANIFTKDMGRASFYNDVNLSDPGRKLVTGWSFANEEDVSVSVAVESAAVENEKVEDEMEDGGSSGAEDTE